MESLENNRDNFQNAADDSMKLIKKFKSILPKKTAQPNAPPTAIALFREPLKKKE